MGGKYRRRSVAYSSPQSRSSQDHSSDTMSPHTAKSFDHMNKSDQSVITDSHTPIESQYTPVDIRPPNSENISLHQDQVNDAESKQPQSDTQLKSIFHIQVTQPEKHGDGIKDSYVSYLIKSKTVLEMYSNPESHVRRRYSDFVWLRNNLINEHSNALIPPLPSRLRLEYLDRFNSTFIEKRRLGLERFLQRVIRHPILSMSESLRSFLELETLQTEMYSESNAMINIGIVYDEGILSEIFGRKTKSPDIRFEKMKQDMNHLESEMKNSWKSHQKLTQVEKDSRTLLSTIAEEMKTFSGIWNDKDLSNMFKKLSLLHDQLYMLQVSHAEASDNNMQALFKEPLDYLGEAKSLLKHREHQQVEYEMTLEKLEEVSREHERLVNTPFTKPNIIEYVNKKLDALRGVDQTTSRQDRVHRLEAKVEDLDEELQKKEKLIREESDAVLREMDIFQKEQILDLKESLIGLAFVHREHHKKCMQLWDEFISNS